PIYPALLIWFLWNFAPGSVTPLQFFLQDKLHADDATFSLWNAIFAGSFIPTYMLYGALCRRVKLGRLIFWGTLVGVPQMIPLLFIHTPQGALLTAAPTGLMGGLASAAYLDLIIRSCPKGLEGTILMMTTAFYYIVSRLGDLLGTALYEKFGGFTICVTAITVVYAAILPTLLLVPRRLLATADGETLEGEAEAFD
ncbi:MAG: MFS transporter, partial [Acidobacteriota bacterium]|nr:MFS transporter [Acidobacteriota bacterium]